MISIGRRFYIPLLKAQGDGFVRVKFKCVECKKLTRAIMIDTVALDVAGGSIVCNHCDMDAWVKMATVVGKGDNQKQADPKKVCLEYNVLN